MKDIESDFAVGVVLNIIVSHEQHWGSADTHGKKDN